MNTYMRFRPNRPRIHGSPLVYFNERILVCAEARNAALTLVKEVRRNG